jgi:cell division protein FtsB
MTWMERHRAVRARRNRIAVLGVLALSVVLPAAWFPDAALYHQHQQSASASVQLQRLGRRHSALQANVARFATSSEMARIARQQYQLVEQGQQAFEVLPPNGSKSSG